MNKDKHLIVIPKTARYFTVGKMNPQTETVWFVLHGYGQLAEYFISKFETVVDEKTFVVAPEALNKFYLKGFTGRIGATWMTKEEREYEIRDYIKYLDSVYNEVIQNEREDKIKINVLGFSQGAHTAVRWLTKSRVSCRNLILWSGTFPANYEIESSIDILNKINLIVVIGNEDEFIDGKSIEIERKRLNALGLQYRLVTFEGWHEIKPEVLSGLLKII